MRARALRLSPPLTPLLTSLVALTVACAGGTSGSAAPAAGAAAEPAPVPDAPVAVAAAPHQAQFVVRSGDRVVTRERYERTLEQFAGEMLIPGQARLTYAAQLAPDATVASMEIKVFPGDTATVPAQIATVVPRGDSLSVTVEAGPVSGTGTMAAPAGTLPIINPSIATFEQIVRRARVLGGGDRAVPIYVTGQEGDPVEAQVAFLGADSATVTVEGVTMRFAIDPDGHVLGGVVPSQSLVVERTTGGQ